MRHHRTVVVALALTLALAIAGCGVSGYNSSCSGNLCTYAFNGAQTLKLDFIRRGSKLELEDFDDRQIKVTAHGREATVPVGERVAFAGFLLELRNLDGDQGTLRIRGAPG